MVQEKENAGHLDLLGSSCLMLARTAASLDPDERIELVPHVRALAEALTELAADLGTRTTRQQAADKGLAIAAGISAGSDQPEPAFASGVMSVRMAATDLMIFAGIEPADAAAAIREGIESRRVAVPPAPGRPLGWLQRVRLPFRRTR